MSSRSKASAVSAAAAASAALFAVSSGSTFVAPGAAALRGSSAQVGSAVADFQHAPADVPGIEASGVVQGLAASTAVTAAAFFLGRRSRSGTSASRNVTACKAFENELGVTLPMKYFDPLGLSKDGDEEVFRRRRVAEIKNGRVAMWACIGYIAPEYFRWPGFCSPSMDVKFAELPNGIQALYKVPSEGWAQIGIFIAFLELFPMRQEADRIPGDAPGFGKLGVPIFARKCDVEGSRRSLEAELNNGRLAMVAITGMVWQNAYLGDNFWLPGASAFESELGVQAPVGFWDPIGLSKDGDADNFRRRRGVELKHGRICMLACTGYIVQEYFRWPGYLSPDKGIKFADMPSGIAAISKVPLEGWLQIGLFIGHYEGFFMRQDPNRAPGDFENYGFLGVGRNFIINFPPATIADPEVRKKKLSAEIANGRLAMVALMGMLFQNGTVGEAGPAMWLPPS
eukprot:TRINITY_DN93854_c0_g1_i1.p1 TRINITY_DN93854_c0_g1~~TRINITY_DN93854_c0_g1_i1.p1  ORF type:complete len:455 (-),score=93.25 TRINITY_DN93854_c0_g1_i1:143-1507(-)